MPLLMPLLVPLLVLRDGRHRPPCDWSCCGCQCSAFATRAGRQYDAKGDGVGRTTIGNMCWRSRRGNEVPSTCRF